MSSRVTGGKVTDLIIASVDPDPSTRTVAVRELLEGNSDDKVPHRATACRQIVHHFYDRELAPRLSREPSIQALLCSKRSTLNRPLCSHT